MQHSLPGVIAYQEIDTIPLDTTLANIIPSGQNPRSRIKSHLGENPPATEDHCCQIVTNRSNILSVAT